MNLYILLLFLILYIVVISSYEEQNPKSIAPANGLSHHPDTVQKGKKYHAKRMKGEKQNQTVKKLTTGKKLKKNRKRIKKIGKRKTRKKKIYDAPTQPQHRRELQKVKNGDKHIFSESKIGTGEVTKAAKTIRSKRRRKKRRKYKTMVKTDPQKTKSKLVGHASTPEESLHRKMKFIPTSARKDQTNKQVPPKILRRGNHKKRLGKKKARSKSSELLNIPQRDSSKLNDEIIVKTDQGKREEEKRMKEVSTIAPPVSIRVDQLPPKEKVQIVNVTDNAFGMLQLLNHPSLKKPGIRIVKPWENGERRVDDDGSVYIVDKKDGSIYFGPTFGSSAINLRKYREFKKAHQESIDRMRIEFEQQGTTENPLEEPFEEDPFESCRPLNNGKCKKFWDAPSKCIKRFKSGACAEGVAWYYLVDMKTGKEGPMQPQIMKFPPPYDGN